MMKQQFGFGKKADSNGVLARCINIERPSEGTELAAVESLVILFTSAVVNYLPAHEAFTVANASDTEDLLPISTKLNCLPDINSSIASNLSVAESFRWSGFVWEEFDVAFTLIVLAEQDWRPAYDETLDDSVLKERNALALQVGTLFWLVKSNLIHLVRGLHNDSSTLSRESCRGVLPEIWLHVSF